MRVRLSGLALACALVCGSAASATESSAELGPIALGDIPYQLERDRARLVAIRGHDPSGVRVDAARDEVRALAAELDEQQRADTLLLAEGADESFVPDLAAAWSQRHRQLRDLERVLVRESAALASDFEALRELRSRWELTQGGVGAAEMPPAIRSLVEAFLLDHAETARRVERDLERIADLSREFAVADRRAEDMSRAIASQAEQLRAAIFRFDRPPLWVVEPLPTTPPLSTWIRLERAGRRSIDYAKRNVRLLLLFAAASLGVVALLVGLQRSAQRHATADASTAVLARVLALPVSGGLLVITLGLLLGAIPSAPRLIGSLIGLGMLLPILRWVGLGIIPGLQGAVLWIGTWYVCETARVLLLPGTYSTRLLLFAESIAGLVLIQWLRRPSRLALLDGPATLLQIVGVGMRLAGPALVVAAAANLFGNPVLAQVLCRGIVTSLYLTYLVYAAHRVLAAALEALLATRIAEKLRIVRAHRLLLRARGARLLELTVTLLWLTVVLRAFRIDEPIFAWVSDVLDVGLTLGSIAISPRSVLLFAAMLWLAVLVARLIRFLLEEELLARAALPRGVPFAVSTIARYVVLVVGFLVAVAAAGLDLQNFALAAGALGVGIGIGLQNVVNNFVSGLILLFERPIQQGDEVEVNGKSGSVREIGLRSSTIRTYDGADVVIPNSEFVSRTFINWTLSDRLRRIDLLVHTAYRTPPSEVIALLEQVAHRMREVNVYPEPVALLKGFGESSLEFELRAWAGNLEDYARIRSELAIAVSDALRDAGIEIPFPQREVHVRAEAVVDRRPVDGVPTPLRVETAAGRHQSPESPAA